MPGLQAVRRSRTQEKDMRTALIIDDHPFIRSSVKLLLKQERFSVVAEAQDGVDGVLMAKTHKPDLIVLDISLPGLDGMEAIARIKELGTHSRIVILTSQAAEHFSLRCMKLGAAGPTPSCSTVWTAPRSCCASWTCAPATA